MKINKILLRWYKSFNVNYKTYDDRRADTKARPWNKLKSDISLKYDFEFIEIPIEKDITTIIGPNECGKSHLLSAIDKVINFSEHKNKYRISDKCFYASVKTINTDIWPNIGLGMDLESFEEYSLLINLIDKADSIELDKTDENRHSFVLILGPKDEETYAYLYLDEEEIPIELSLEALNRVREIFPIVKLIDSAVAISDEIPLAQLIANYDDKPSTTARSYYAKSALNEVAEKIGNYPDNAGISLEELKSLKEPLQSEKFEYSRESILETMLFRDILRIEKSTLENLYNLEKGDRSYADGLVQAWNKKIEDTLNLSRYWQQDEFFKLHINLKDGIIYFEITDKTGSTYTFNDRSSGLRYFLSYYIQAKAIEISNTNSNCIILMDEPDSYLSSVGQKNLIEIFETLVRPEFTEENCQLIYTTHSPFLINKNYPRRIRLLQKGDAEEGSQYIKHAMLRRFEPIRTALGIDCAQTLFLGSTNLILEGPTDQYILTELIRTLHTYENSHRFIDLNQVVIVSAESSSRIEQLLIASIWNDEPMQCSVVLLDADEAGNTASNIITGKARNKKKLIDEKYVVSYQDVFSEETELISIEDLVPTKMYLLSLESYLKKWEGLEETKITMLIESIEQDNNSKRVGIVNKIRYAFGSDLRLDKMGVSEMLIEKLSIDTDTDFTQEMEQDLEQKLILLCTFVKEKINLSTIEMRKSSFKSSIQRILSDFLNIHQDKSPISDLDTLTLRLINESEATVVPVEEFHDSVTLIRNIVLEHRNRGVSSISTEHWPSWFAELNKIKKDPISPKKIDTDCLLSTSENMPTSI